MAVPFWAEPLTWHQSHFLLCDQTVLSCIHTDCLSAPTQKNSGMEVIARACPGDIYYTMPSKMYGGKYKQPKYIKLEQTMALDFFVFVLTWPQYWCGGSFHYVDAFGLIFSNTVLHPNFFLMWVVHLAWKNKGHVYNGEWLSAIMRHTWLVSTPSSPSPSLISAVPELQGADVSLNSGTPLVFKKITFNDLLMITNLH